MAYDYQEDVANANANLLRDLAESSTMSPEISKLMKMIDRQLQLAESSGDDLVERLNCIRRARAAAEELWDVLELGDGMMRANKVPINCNYVTGRVLDRDGPVLLQTILTRFWDAWHQAFDAYKEEVANYSIGDEAWQNEVQRRRGVSAMFGKTYDGPA